MFSSMFRSEDTIGSKTAQVCWTQLSPCTRWWACSCTKSDPREKLPNKNETYFQLICFSQQKTTNHKQQQHNYYTTMFQKTSLGSSMLTTKISGLTDALYSGKGGAGIKCRSPSIEFWVTRSDALIVSSLWFYVHLEIENWNNTLQKKGYVTHQTKAKKSCVCLFVGQIHHLEWWFQTSPVLADCPKNLILGPPPEVLRYPPSPRLLDMSEAAIKKSVGLSRLLGFQQSKVITSWNETFNMRVVFKQT